MADYRKMWSDLGMDLENMTFCVKLYLMRLELYIVPENRPEGMDF